MPSEDNILKKIMDLQAVLLNKHKLPTLFAFQSKHGLITFGSKHVMAKFGREFNDDWENVFNQDLDDLLSIPQDEDYYEEERWGNPHNFTRAEKPPMKLPADLELMVYRELWQWVSAKIFKEYWRNGGKKKVVRYGDPDFAPSFWPNHIWAWQEVNKNPKNLKASDYSGPGTITEFLKKVIKARLEQLNIDPADYVSNKFDDKKREDR